MTARPAANHDRAHGQEHAHENEPEHELGHDHDHGHDNGHGHDHGHDHGHGGGIRGRLTALLRPHSHDSADQVDSALAGSVEGMRALKISLVILGITAGVQFAVVLASSSVALFADTIHNFADAMTAIPIGIAFIAGPPIVAIHMATGEVRTSPGYSCCWL